MGTILKNLGSAALSWTAGGGVAVYLACAGAGLLAGGYVGWTVNGWRWEAAVSEQKAEASKVLAAETKKALDLEREAAAIKARADAAYQEQQRTIEDAHDKNRDLDGRLHDALERLRKSGRGGRGDGAAGAVPGAAGGCAGLQAAYDQLSGTLERLARAGTELARSADREAAVAGAAQAAAADR